MLRALLLTLPLVTLTSGCMVSTTAVREVGVERATLSPRKVAQLSNGAWLIEGKLARVYGAAESYTRYLYVHPEVAFRETALAMTRAPLRRDGARWIDLEFPSDISKDGLDLLIFPPSFEPIDATLADHVPAGLYRGATLEWQPIDCFQVSSVAGDEDIVTLDLTYCRTNWSRHSAVHYPAQFALLPPAIALDVGISLALGAAIPLAFLGYGIFGP